MSGYTTRGAVSNTLGQIAGHIVIVVTGSVKKSPHVGEAAVTADV